MENKRQDMELIDLALDALELRSKELNCLYQIEEVLKDYNRNLDLVLKDVIDTIPTGWHYPDICRARITYGGQRYHPPDFTETEWHLSAYINVQDKKVGDLDVFYLKEMPPEDVGSFLNEEVKLIINIARRLGSFIQHQNLQKIFQDVKKASVNRVEEKVSEWRIVVNLARRMDHELFLRITHKMLNYLCWTGVREANAILQQISSVKVSDVAVLTEGENVPMQTKKDMDMLTLSKEIFEIADRNLPDEEILSIVQKWMQEDRASFMIRTLVSLDSSLSDIADAIRRFIQIAPDGKGLSDSTMKGIRVALVRQIISDQLDYIKVAKNHVEINDFAELLQRMIYPVDSHGQVGGKSAGLFLAWQIIKKYKTDNDILKDIKVPKTWYLTSDGMHNFMRNNNLEEVTEQKYKDIGLVRQEYPYIIQVFKSSSFTPEIVQGLSMALDDFGETPIIVRSSSLLEDRFGAAFSGKYKSLFLANQGSKDVRLQALMDAIAEVYSSTFGSDPIEYRAERGLVDFKEEMGVIIQEVVGTKAGKYFLPSYAGVAFSNNEFRWSPRIKREDGLVRLVPGLGTRAVDRLADDFPVLIAPGQPGLRVNVTPDEIIRYSPNKMDMINLETNAFETVEVSEFLKEYGEDLPAVMQMISVERDGQIQQPSFMNLDFEHDSIVVTFNGLISNTPFIRQMHEILNLLQDNFGTPVDIEFASDGKNFYLLQCRPQGTSPDSAPAPIPKDIPESAIVFSANKHISNGAVPDITHIVYVDPEQYNSIKELSMLRDVGRAVSKLNKVLPKRRFILMGPGRWGSRGDVKLGVDVTYSDINNTAVLIEIARKKGNYMPDLSFGTHFFQDLVEASIRYLPLYPDDDKILFNDQFLLSAKNILADILPEYGILSDVVRVIDVPKTTDGKVLKLFMNADLEEAIGVLSHPSSKAPQVDTAFMAPVTGRGGIYDSQQPDDHWRWRLHMAEIIAEQMEPDRFGLKAFYVVGSTKNATAGPDADIDILLHFTGTDEQKNTLLHCLEGWSKCLDEMNYLRTGYRLDGLLDVHFITDEDIEKRRSYALKIGAVTDAAKEIPMGKGTVK